LRGKNLTNCGTLKNCPDGFAESRGIWRTMMTSPFSLQRLLYYNLLKFPVSPSVYPLGKRTPVSHCWGFSTGLGI
jgi:hypothetical protein